MAIKVIRAPPTLHACKPKPRVTFRLARGREMADISELADEELVPKKGSFLEWIGMNVSRSKFTKLINTTDCEKTRPTHVRDL